MNCGRVGIPVLRPDAKKRETHHRKKLYCITCKTEVNHIECKNSFEVAEFMKNFMKGAYIDEAQNSLSFVGNSGMR
jgi:hypothetical protein